MPGAPSVPGITASFVPSITGGAGGNSAPINAPASFTGGNINVGGGNFWLALAALALGGLWLLRKK